MSHLCELNDEERTMNDYKKTYQKDLKKPAAAEKAPAKKSPAKKAISSKKKNLTKVQTLRKARRKKQDTWSWNGKRMGKVVNYVIKKGKRVAKK